MKNPLLRIGYLVQQFPPEVGAGPARVAEMAAYWRDQGAEVTVITGMPNRPEGRIHPEYRGKLFTTETWEGIRVHRSWLYASPKHGFARTLLNNITFMATGLLNGLVRAGRFDVLIASSPPFFPHISGVILGSTRRMPVVLEVRDLWPDYLVDMGVLKGRLAPSALFGLERRLLQSADHVVAVTESFRKRISGKGVPLERIAVIPNGVDASLYYASPEESQGRESGVFNVGYLGNFGAGQHLTTIVEAAARVAEVAPEIRFRLIGDGPDRARVEARAAELKLSNLTIHPPIPKDRTREFYASCDICLVPLAPVAVFQETVPSKIFEIMACERPVVASLAGEAARIVEESGGGVVVPPGDADGVAEGVMRLYRASSHERQLMGASGRAYVLANYDRLALAAKYLEVLLAAANGSQGAVRAHIAGSGGGA